MHVWVLDQSRIADALTPTATMRFMVRTADDSTGHWVEAGLDRFEVLAHSPFLAEPTLSHDVGIELFPDPSDGRFTLRTEGMMNGRVNLLDMEGRAVMDPVRMVHGVAEIVMEPVPGIYIVRLEGADGGVRTLRAVVR